MSYDHALYYEVLTASDSASVPTEEIYRRPTRRRLPRQSRRRRLLHQHFSCPNTFFRRGELSTTSGDELGVWASRRTRSDLPPMGAARCYKTERPRCNLRTPRACPTPTSRRGPSCHRRTTTIVHHPCCLLDPSLCPVMKGSHHQQKLRPEDIDSETLRNTKVVRGRIESFLQQHQRCQPQKVPCQPEAAPQMPGTKTQHQSKQMQSPQQSDPREKKCGICGNSQHIMESTVGFAQPHRRQPSPPPVGHPLRTIDMLTRDVSSETAEWLVDELSRLSTGPRATQTFQRVNVGEISGQQRNLSSGNTMSHFLGSPMVAGPRKGEAGLTTLNLPLGEIQEDLTSLQNVPRRRSTATSPFLEEYSAQCPSPVLQQGNEMPSPASFKARLPITQHDVETSYTMQSIASARAASIKKPDNADPRGLASNFAYSQEKVVSQPENVTVNYQQATRRAVSEGAKPSDDTMSPTSPGKGLFTLGGECADDSRNNAEYVDPELRSIPQSDPNSARFPIGTNVGGSTSSNGEFQSGKQTPALSGGSPRHMAAVEQALKNWHRNGNDAAQVSGVHPRTDKLSSPFTSVYRAAAAGDGIYLHGYQRASPQASPTSQKSVKSPVGHMGDCNHQEADARKSGNFSHNNVNVARNDDSTVYSRRSFAESHSKPGGTGDTSFCSDNCCSSTYRSMAKEGDKQQESPRNFARGVTLSAGSGCTSTVKAEERVVASSRATTRSDSIATSTKTVRRRTKDRDGADGNAVASQTKEMKGKVAVDTQLMVNEQLKTTRKQIIEHIDNALACIMHPPSMDLSKFGSIQKLQSACPLTERSKSPMTDNGDISYLEALRDYSSLELSYELWSHVDNTVRDSLRYHPQPQPQQQPTKLAAAPSAEDRSNRKLLVKIQRDLTKNILTNLKRLEDIESLLHHGNSETPNAPPSKGGTQFPEKRS